jgi:hypothetical protein
MLYFVATVNANQYATPGEIYHSLFGPALYTGKTRKRCITK